MSAQTFDTRIGRKFAELIDDRMKTVTGNVMNGTYSDREYGKETGRFNGLREALDIYEEAEAMVKAAERS